MHKQRYQNIQMSFREVNNMNDNFNIDNTTIIPKFQNIQTNFQEKLDFLSENTADFSHSLFIRQRRPPY